MKTKIHTILNLNNFFSILNTTEKTIEYKLQKPSRMLMENVYVSWLQSIFIKTHKNFPVYLNGKCINGKKWKQVPYGLIKDEIIEYKDGTLLKCECKDYNMPTGNNYLRLEVMVHQQDIMQYFFQWQRYRKYWWSSITTTPSLFKINEIKCEEEAVHVDIIADFCEGQQVVETISYNNTNFKNISCLSCNLSLEGSLFILLLDALTPNNKYEYLRFHRKMAPFKISFALNYQDEKQKKILSELATLLSHKLKCNEVSTWLPDFSLSLQSQIQEGLHMGVTYTAVLSEDTLRNGIFHLINSSTMMKEQIHIGDVESYVTLICKK